MRSYRRLTVIAVASAVACAFAASLASVVSAGLAVVKQRIAIVEEGNPDPDVNGLFFDLIPLTAGALTRDSGTVVESTGQFLDPVIRNGQQVFPLVGTDTLSGKQGTFKIVIRVDSTDINSKYSVQVGTWSFKNGTGAYAGFTGGGRFAGVFLMQKNHAISRLEGFISKR